MKSGLESIRNVWMTLTSGNLFWFALLHCVSRSTAKARKLVMISQRGACWWWRAMKRPESGQSLLATTAAMEGLSGWLLSGCETSAPKKIHRECPILWNWAGWSQDESRKFRPPHFKLIFIRRLVMAKVLSPRPSANNISPFFRRRRPLPEADINKSLFIWARYCPLYITRFSHWCINKWLSTKKTKKYKLEK